MNPTRTARDLGWCALILLMGVLAACGVAMLVWSVRRGDWFTLVRTPCTLLFAYWVAVGAWRRTSWGLVIVEGAGATINATHARRLVLLAAACPVVLAFSLAVQVVLGRS